MPEHKSTFKQGVDFYAKEMGAFVGGETTRLANGEYLASIQKEIDNLKKQNQELQQRIENLTLNKQSLSDEDLNRISQIVKDAINPVKADENISDSPESAEQERSG